MIEFANDELGTLIEDLDDGMQSIGFAIEYMKNIKRDKQLERKRNET